MIDETLLEAEEKMEKAVEVAKEDFSAIRTGRANRGHVQQDHGRLLRSPTPLQQLASFPTPEARIVIISPYDRSSMSAIEKSIRDSDLGVNPTNDGTIIRIVLPQLTEERRREYIKVATAQGRGRAGLGAQHPAPGQGRAGPHRRDGEAGEDEVARAEKELEQVTKRHVELIDELLRHKEPNCSRCDLRDRCVLRSARAAATAAHPGARPRRAGCGRLLGAPGGPRAHLGSGRRHWAG